MASYSSDFGMLFPSEGGFKRPGAYGEFISAQGQLRQQALTEMDRFFASLEEQRREFDIKMEETGKLEREKMDLQRELQENEQLFEKWKVGEYKKIAQLQANAQNQRTLGGTVTGREVFDQMNKMNSQKLDILRAQAGAKGAPVPNYYKGSIETGTIYFPDGTSSTGAPGGGENQEKGDDYYGRHYSYSPSTVQGGYADVDYGFPSEAYSDTDYNRFMTEQYNRPKSGSSSPQVYKDWGDYAY